MTHFGSPAAANVATAIASIPVRDASIMIVPEWSVRSERRRAYRRNVLTDILLEQNMNDVNNIEAARVLTPFTIRDVPRRVQKKRESTRDPQGKARS